MRKMSEEGEEKKRDAVAIGPHSKPNPDHIGFPIPATPLEVAGTYPPGASAAYPYPASGIYPIGAGASLPPPAVQVPYATGLPYYSQGYGTDPGDAAQITTSKIERLPCCGLGFGWFLFIIGFFLAAIPWYVGAFIIIFVGVDYREKPGYIACSIAAAIAAIAAFFGLIQQAARW
ncbi:60S ribosomal protein L18a-like protein [Phalaenopsis equestris]|uniref:60S ribosomal protein L18a-like protein n=1 Tax=Phalaenopsis equestris TaxID=78828 RepID=UPI0009E22D68|nr:60S ribosomal protein L18a-like protein [Phalaenopsis equestris]